MDLFLIRHGESSNNALADASQRVAEPELTDKGREQKDCVAEYIGEGLHLYPAEREEDRPFLDRLYCSAMIRALHTSEPIGRALSLAPEIWVDIHETGGIFLDHGGERGKVGYSGQTRAEIAGRFPDAIAPAAIGDDGWWNKGMEEWHEAHGRGIAVAAQLVARAGDKERIGLVTHGNFMSLLIQALGNQLPGGGAVYEHDNTAITRISIESDNFMLVEYLNRTEHLSDGLRMPRRLPMV